MTREEISEKAAFLTMQVTLKLTGSGSDMIGAATDEMVKFYRATLEEAARAVCQGCCEMNYDPLTQDHRRQTSEHGDFEGGPCSAVAIHDLIAALEKP